MRLTKHHGLENDFLVLLDAAGDQPVDAELARRTCDRHTGIGADGIIRATRFTGEADGPLPDAVMELYNADGSRAEMSGNGIRCLAQALVLDEWVADKPGEPAVAAIQTDAGLRIVSLRETVDAYTHRFAVDMGAVRFDGEAASWVDGPVIRAAWADMGNPHLVLLLDAERAAEVDLVKLGERANALTPRGGNVHVVLAGAAADAITIRSYERGVGLTQACGTGACASAAVAREWGLVGDVVDVQQPGGDAQVVLGATVELTGPAVAIAAVDYPLPS
jgi:diaminopimelate epimerase